MRRKDWGAAERTLAALIRRTGTNDAALMADMAQSALAKGEGGRARVYARAAYRLMPGNAALADLWAQALLQSGGSRVEARDLLEKALAIQPDVSLYREHLEKAR